MTYVNPDKNILEPFCTKMHCDAIRLTVQSGYSICLFYGQVFHPYSKPNIYTIFPYLINLLPHIYSLEYRTGSSDFQVCLGIPSGDLRKRCCAQPEEVAGRLITLVGSHGVRTLMHWIWTLRHQRKTQQITRDKEYSIPFSILHCTTVILAA